MKDEIRTGDYWVVNVIGRNKKPREVIVQIENVDLKEDQISGFGANYVTRCRAENFLRKATIEEMAIAFDSVCRYSANEHTYDDEDEYPFI